MKTPDEIANETRLNFNKLTIDERINFMLPFFVINPDEIDPVKEAAFKAMLFGEEGKKFITATGEMLEEKGLLRLTKYETPQKLTATVEARRIVENGGWLKHINKDSPGPYKRFIRWFFSLDTWGKFWTVAGGLATVGAVVILYDTSYNSKPSKEIKKDTLTTQKKSTTIPVLYDSTRHK